MGMPPGELRAWDAATGEEVFRFPGTLWNAVHSEIDTVTFNPDGDRLVASSTEGNVRFWGIAERAQVLELRGHQGAVRQLSFSPDGRRLASAGRDGTLRFWDPAAGLEVGVLSGPPAGLGRVAFSPDGHRLLTAGLDGKALQVWDGTPRPGPDTVPPR
jgi:WD40 repeat protein